MNEVSIKVEIAGGLYPLKIKAEDEENVVRVVSLINTKIDEFEKTYAVKDKKDVLAMVMLQLVSQYYQKAEEAEKELSHFKILLIDVEMMLQEHLDSIKKIDE
ncbi:MAG: cell division protein ZapA [Bacteroidia bacterium]|nr:cell division protein ZapA [Bacteroidia bacterium]MBN8693794.1 cell division protein ZapA [Bacteroidota bacterium]